MSNEIGFGIVGCGMIGKVHAEAIQAIPGARLLAVCGRDAAKTAEFAAKFDAAAYTDYAQFLAQSTAQTRQFIEKQLKLAVTNQQQAEAKLEQFRLTHKIYNLEDAIAQAPDVKSPAGLRDKLDGVNSDFAEYQSTRRQLDELAGMLGDLDAQARREWDVRLRRLHALLEAMTPESVESFKQLQTDIAQAGSELQNAQPGVGSFNLSAKSANEPLFIQLGLNARAALITRGLAEMTRLGVALGARTETFMPI